MFKNHDFFCSIMLTAFLKGGLAHAQTQATTSFQLTSAMEIFIGREDELATTPQLTNTSSPKSAVASQAQTRITKLERSVSERDLILIVTIAGGALLVLAMVFVILLVIKVRKLKRDKRQHEQEMTRVKQVYENRLSQFTVSAVDEAAVDVSDDDTRKPTNSRSMVDYNVNLVDNRRIIVGQYQASMDESVLDVMDDDEKELNQSMRF